MKQGNGTSSFYVDMKFIIPLIVFVLGFFISGGLAIICLKRSKFFLIEFNSTTISFCFQDKTKRQLKNSWIISKMQKS